MERWATFDCYGTLVDWNAGIGGELARIFGDEHAEEMLRRYHELEAIVEAGNPSLSYRDVMATVLDRLDAPAAERASLGDSLPRWPVFPEVPDALREARARGWKLCILSNTDRDLLDASLAAMGVPFDRSIVASEIGSYKPAHGHWRTFEAQVGRLPDVHVAASLFHDIAAAELLELPSIWINRLGEDPGTLEPDRTLPDLSGLPDALDALVAA